MIRIPAGDNVAWNIKVGMLQWLPLSLLNYMQPVLIWTEGLKKLYVEDLIIDHSIDSGMMVICDAVHDKV